MPCANHAGLDVTICCGDVVAPGLFRWAAGYAPPGNEAGDIRQVIYKMYVARVAPGPNGTAHRWLSPADKGKRDGDHGRGEDINNKMVSIT